jgi:transcriptional regulator with XRE-family HTH domain
MTPTDPTSEHILQRIQSDPVARRAYRDQMAMTWLGDALRQAREKVGLTQTKAAALAGMTQGELSRVENGLPVKGITFTTLVGLSEALGFNIVFEIHTHRSGQVSMAAMSQAEALTQHLAVREIV